LIDSFLEWSDEELLAGRPKMVGRFGMTCGRLMPVAGICSTTYTPVGPVQTCSVVTCEPNEMLEGLPHHRMPAILQGDDLRAWLDPLAEHPENALHATASVEMEARIVPAKQMRELVR
jgi:putative SOS response-associated peptidase YedK